jgi:ATP-dependent helicase/nuclease subunit B
VVAAGSTGSIPATADLLAVIARLDRGCVVLPGLDAELPARAWDALPESHPQYGLARLLAHIGVAREEVRPFAADWPHGVEPAAPAPRARVLSAAMNPEPQEQAGMPGAALAGVGLANCPSSSDEAATIALRMRGALESPGATAALVTPDRGLARRVAARLGHWGIEVDDSAGTPLPATSAGSFFRLIAEMVGDGFAPLGVLGCLKHPLAAGGMEPARFRDTIRALEIHVLRGPRPAPGLRGLRQRINTALESAARQDRETLTHLGSWARDLAQLMAPFAAAMSGPDIALGDIVRAHVGAAEALAATATESGATRLWRGDDGEALAGFAAEILDTGTTLPKLPGARYPALLGALMAGRVVRPGWGRHPRLFIWGPLEARLQHADVMILGGLNEGTWPPDAGSDPWMSRPMRAALGLPLPERRIGLAAHDFAQAFSAPEVLLTRAEREGGTPTVPSRWLARLENALPEAEFVSLKARGETWRQAAAQRDEPSGGGGVATARPAPKPPVAARPRKLSVTEIETLQINPYAIYAKRVLGLRPLDELDADAGAAERGTFTHRALQIFLDDWPDSLPDGGVDGVTEKLIEIGREVFRPVAATPGLYAFWWPRFVRVARWVAEAEIARRPALLPLGAECRGEMVIEAPGGPFTLSGIADRVDLRAADNGLVIVDYKTGGLPTGKDQTAGFAPQLPLLAAMAEVGGFKDIEPGQVMELAYWRLTGGDPVGEAKTFVVPAAEAAAAALKGLKALIALFDDPGWPYRPRPVAGQEPRFDDYAHLARVQEWSTQDSGGEGGEG